VCRTQPLSIEGVDPEGAYRVQVDGEPATIVLPRSVRTIQALLSKKSETGKAPSRRTPTPGTIRFLDLAIVGDPDHFVERSLRITQLPEAEGQVARVAILAAMPERTGRVT
jgi:hypothetical protein